jgi:hypothetical protein
MVESMSFNEALQGISDLGLSWLIDGDIVEVLFAGGRYPAGVEILKLRRDMNGFYLGKDSELIEVEENLPEAWKEMPGYIFGYLTLLDGVGLRLCARRDIMGHKKIYYIASDGFVGGENMGGKEGGLPSLVLMFDELGSEKGWGVYISNKRSDAES